MKRQIITKLLTATAMVMGGITLSSQPSQAQNTLFYCSMSGGIPTTMAQTSRGNIPVIRWVSQHFSDSGYSPKVRCQEVSSRFQNYYNQGVLNYITTGYMNSQPVVCVTSTNGGSCSQLLFTLKPGQNASRTLQQLFDIRQGAAGPLYEGTGGSNQAVYIDVNNYLETAPVDTEATGPNSSSPSTQTPQNSSPSNDKPGAVW